MNEPRPALVILSGGQDSTTCLFWAKALRFEPLHAISFDYGQRHARELESANEVGKRAGVASHTILRLGRLLHSSSPLVSAQELERYESHEQMERVIGDRVELTFVPMRNALFLTIAANRAAELGCKDLVTGVCESDNANYPDCRKSFIDAQQRAIREAMGDVRWQIHAPLLGLTKAQTVQLARELPDCWEALAYTHTAYDGSYPPTGNDHASVLRAHGFEQAGYADPLVLRAWREGLLPQGLPPGRHYDAYRHSATRETREERRLGR